MKNRWILAVTASLLAASVWAGRAWSEPRASTMEEGGPGREGRPRWEHKGLDMMKEYLGISDDQAARLKGAFEARRKAAEPLHKELRVGLAKLRWQVEAEADAKEIEATLAQLDKTRKALQDQQDKFVAGLSDILTPAQRAKMLLARVGPGGFHGGGPGMPGGFPPRGMRHPGEGPQERFAPVQPPSPDDDDGPGDDDAE